MKKIFLITCLLLATFAFGKFNKHATISPLLVQNGIEKQWSPISGQKISDYYKTSYIAKLKVNSTLRQYSSIYGLIIDMMEYGIDKKSIKVVNVTNQKYINVKKAFFVIHSKTDIAAFEKEEDALLHVKKYTGEIVNFKKALHAVKENLKFYIKEKKIVYKKRIYPMGKKIFEKKCKDDIDFSDYLEINELKADLLKKCSKLKETRLQALALYLWDIKRKGNLVENVDSIKVNKSEKCPVCGMFAYKYPKWAAQIFYKHDNHEHHLSFDGVKDLMKFYFNPSKWGGYTLKNKNNISKVLVTDYYSQKAIDGKNAYFVVGSNIYGPMGNELIPFEKQSDAKTFMLDHKGKSIIKFDEIKQSDVYKL